MKKAPSVYDLKKNYENLFPGRKDKVHFNKWIDDELHKILYPDLDLKEIKELDHLEKFYISKKQASDLLGLSQDTINIHLKVSGISFIKKFRKNYYLKTDFFNWVKKQKLL